MDTERGALPRRPSIVEGWPGTPRRPLRPWYNVLGLPRPLTGKQIWYLAGPQCVGAAIISGAVNFAVAIALYRTVKAPSTILVWPLAHNTVAGDCAVTTFIQGIITFVAVSSLVHLDLRLRRIDPFPHPWPDTSIGMPKVDINKAKTKMGRLIRIFHNEQGLTRGLHFFSGSDAQDLLDFRNVKGKEMLARWTLGVWKGSVLSALFFLVWWPITIAIIAPLYGGRNMQGTWIPPVIKLIYGFTLALVQNPIVAAIALGSEDACRLHVRDEQIKRWQDLSGAPVTFGEKAGPLSITQIQRATSPRQSLDVTGLENMDNTQKKRQSLDMANLRRSLDNGPIRNSHSDFIHVADLRRSLELGALSHAQRSKPTSSTSTPRPVLQRSQSDSAHDFRTQRKTPKRTASDHRQPAA